MSGLWQVLLLSLLPGAGNFAGGLLTEYSRATPRLLNWALHAASGIMLAIVAVELMPRALDAMNGAWVAVAFAAGGYAYVWLQRGVQRLQRCKGSRGKARMWMIYIAVAID